MLCLSLLTAIWVYLGTENRNCDTSGQEKPLADIRTFVRQTFIHGVTYEEAIKYDPTTTVPVLIELINDPDFWQARANIATTLGILGDERAIEPLINLAESGEGVLSRTEYNAKTGAIGALGLILNRQINTRAFTYLTGLARADTQNIKSMKWNSPYHTNPADRDEDLTSVAIIALGLSGRKEAETFLNSLAGQNSTPPSRQESLNSTIEEALKTNRAIQQGEKDGLQNYFNKEIQ